MCLGVYGNGAALFEEEEAAYLKSRGWRRLEVVQRPNVGLRVAVLVRGGELCLAVRGTELDGKNDSRRNVADDIRLGLHRLPRIIEPLLEIVSGMADWQSIHLTGHSLGASAVNFVYASLAMHDKRWLDRITQVVLFENPGVTQQLLADAREKLGEGGYRTLESKVVQYFGAPNPINLCLPHMAGTRIRVKLPHLQTADAWFVAKCCWGSASRALTVGGLVARAAVAVSTAGAAGAAATAGGTSTVVAAGAPTAAAGGAAAVAGAGGAGAAVQRAAQVWTQAEWIEMALSLGYKRENLCHLVDQLQYGGQCAQCKAVRAGLERMAAAAKAAAEAAASTRAQAALAQAARAAAATSAAVAGAAGVAGGVVSSVATATRDHIALHAQGLSEGADSAAAWGAALQATYGVADFCDWVAGQHLMAGMRAAFEPGTNRPRECAAIRQWPDGRPWLIASAAKQFVTSFVPFHPANDGLHTVCRRGAMVESRVQCILGYEEAPEEGAA